MDERPPQGCVWERACTPVWAHLDGLPVGFLALGMCRACSADQKLQGFCTGLMGFRGFSRG